MAEILPYVKTVNAEELCQYLICYTDTKNLAAVVRIIPNFPHMQQEKYFQFLSVLLCICSVK